MASSKTVETAKDESKDVKHVGFKEEIEEAVEEKDDGEPK
jgi:hypothetical protein